jgi:NitT/TauT family transport system ATP-binding protein
MARTKMENKRMLTGSSLVALNNVSMEYGRGKNAVRAVEGLTLTLHKGEFIAVVGPSGCGKSSMMKIISGLMPISGGTLTIEGEPIKGPVSKVGMAFQSSNLLPWRTAVDNVLLPLEIVMPHRRLIHTLREKYRERARALLESVGLKGFTEKFPWELSGGMQQRASICRALIHEPEILVLDEPFGALDAFTREEQWCMMRDLHAKKGISALLVTHDLREAVFLCDTVYVMSDRPGKIVHVQKVDLPRPRELDVIYTPEFQALVIELRSHIKKH